MNASRAPRPNAAIDGFIRIVDALSIAATYVAAGCLILLTLLMLAQIGVAALSKVVVSVRGDIPVAWEYGSYLMGATFMLGTSMTLRSGRHIRLGMFTDGAAPAVRKYMDILVSLIGLALVGFLTFSLGRATVMAIISGSSSIASRTPLWIPYSVFAVGCLLLSLQLVARVLAGLTNRPLESAAMRVVSNDLE